MNSNINIVIDNDYKFNEQNVFSFIKTENEDKVQEYDFNNFILKENNLFLKYTNKLNNDSIELPFNFSDDIIFKFGVNNNLIVKWLFECNKHKPNNALSALSYVFNIIEDKNAAEKLIFELLIPFLNSLELWEKPFVNYEYRALEISLVNKKEYKGFLISNSDIYGDISEAIIYIVINGELEYKMFRYCL